MMSEPTRKEMLEEIDKQRIAIIEMMQFSGRAGYHRDDLEKKGILLDAIRRLIEARPMSKEFWHKWSGRIQDDYNLGSMYVIYLVESMLREFGHEMKEKKEMR